MTDQGAKSDDRCWTIIISYETRIAPCTEQTFLIFQICIVSTHVIWKQYFLNSTLLQALSATINRTSFNLTFIPPTASCLVAIILPWGSIRCLNISCFYIRALHRNKLVTASQQPAYNLWQLQMFRKKYLKQRWQYTNPYHIKVLLPTDVHCIKTNYGTLKGWEGDIKLHFFGIKQR